MTDPSDLEKTLEYRPPQSLRPVALEAEGRRRAISSASLVVLLLTGFAFVGALVARVSPVEPAPSPRAPTFAREVPAAPAAPSTPSAISDVPVVDVASLPRPPIGTIIGLPKHRLWIDGRLAPGWKRTVKCGAHTVQVGSQGAPRAVEVPCGGEISVGP